MKVLTKLKKYGIAVATFVFCCCMTLLFAIGVGYTVRAEETAGQEQTHSCFYFTHPGEEGMAMEFGGVNNQIWSVLMRDVGELDDSAFATGLFTGYMYLTEDITWEETVYIPRNVHVAICLNGYSMDCEFICSTLGDCGVYFYDCTETHTCSEVLVDGQAIELPVINQDLVNFMPYWGFAGGGLPSMTDLYVALGSDVDFNENWRGALGYSGSLTICLNGYSAMNTERLTLNGGSLKLIDCQPDKACNYLIGNEAENTTALELGGLLPEEFADVVEFINGYTEEVPAPYAVHCTLKGNVNLAETLVIPENVYFGVCLNGYYLNMPVDEPENGGLYTFSCKGSHECASLYEEVPYLSQDLIDFLPMWLIGGGTTTNAFMTTHFALNSNITFSELWNGYGAGTTLVFCTRGFTVKNAEILGAKVTTIDCATDEVCRVCHPIGDMKNIPLYEVDLTKEDVYVQETLKDGSGTQTITKKAIDCFTPYVDENGVFVGDGSGETRYFFSLQTDIKLANTLVIPAGFDIHICLNGYTLESPKIIFYKDKEDVVAIFNIEYGGSLSIYDCSPEQSGMMFTNINDRCTETNEGFDLSGLGVIFAYSVLNNGSFTLNGGSMAAMIGIISTGDVIINSGEVGGAFAGIVQGNALDMDGLEMEDATPSVTLNGGAISSALMGVVADQGSVVMDGGTIKTVGVAIAAGADLNGEPIKDSTVSLVINDGAIEYSESLLDIFETSGLLDELDINYEELANANVKDFVAIMAQGTVEMNGDLDITYSDLILQLQANNAARETEELQKEADSKLEPGQESVPVDPVVYDRIDIQLAGNTSISVGEDTEFENQYTVKAEDGATITNESLAHVFVGANGYATVYTSDGELVLVALDGDTIFLAKAVGATASTSGLILLNFYVELDQAFIDNEASRVIIRTKADTYSYKVSEGKKSGSYYIFSVGINAKDYKDQVICEFSMPVFVGDDTTKTITWLGKVYSIVEYLDYLLNDTTGRYDSAKNIAKTMKDYCMSASVHFGTASEYEYSSGTEEALALVNADVLENFKTEVANTSENITLQGATLFLEFATTIRIYFTVNEGVDINSLVCTVNGKVATPTYHSADYYFIEIENIAAGALGTAYDVSVDGATLRYSAMSYVHTTITQSRGTSETTLATAKMLYLYYMATVEYTSR